MDGSPKCFPYTLLSFSACKTMAVPEKRVGRGRDGAFLIITRLYQCTVYAVRTGDKLFVRCV